MLEEIGSRFLYQVRMVAQQTVRFLVAQRLPLDAHGSEPGPGKRSNRLVPFQNVPRRDPLLVVQPSSLALLIRAVKVVDLVPLKGASNLYIIYQSPKSKL